MQQIHMGNEELFYIIQYFDHNIFLYLPLTRRLALQCDDFYLAHLTLCSFSEEILNTTGCDLSFP